MAIGTGALMAAAGKAGGEAMAMGEAMKKMNQMMAYANIQKSLGEYEKQATQG